MASAALRPRGLGWALGPLCLGWALRPAAATNIILLLMDDVSGAPGGGPGGGGDGVAPGGSPRGGVRGLERRPDDEEALRELGMVRLRGGPINP